MIRSFFLAALLNNMAGVFRPRAPDMADLPDTTDSTVRQLRADYANETKFPSHRHRLRMKARTK